MKVFLHCTLLSVLLCCVACQQNTEALSEELNNIAIENAQYLTNNYQPNQTVVFIQDQDSLHEQTWTVTECHDGDLNIFARGAAPSIDESRMRIIMTYGGNTILLYNRLQILKEGIVQYMRFDINKQSVILDTFGETDATKVPVELDEEEVCIFHGDVWCVLKRNVGITRFSNGAHSWILKGE